MKKKVVALVLAAAMTFGLTACGGGGDSAGTDNASGAAAESADGDAAHTARINVFLVDHALNTLSVSLEQTVFFQIHQISLVDQIGGNNFGVLLGNSDELKVVNLFETDEYMNFCKRVYNWNQLGYISKDAVPDPGIVHAVWQKYPPALLP